MYDFTHNSLVRALAFYSGAPAIRRLFRHRVQKVFRIYILMYHKVAPSAAPYFGGAVHPEVFRRQVAFLSRHFNLMALEDISRRPHHENGRDTAILTFDDGYESVYNWAFPILKEYNLPATVFLATDYIGGHKLLWPDHLAWLLYTARDRLGAVKSLPSDIPQALHDGIKRFLAGFGDSIASLRSLGMQIKHYSPGQRDKLFNTFTAVFNIRPQEHFEGAMLSWKQVREMAENQICFGAHTQSHCALSRTQKETVADELSGSKQEIEKQLGKKVTSFAYPYGKAEDFTAENIDQVKRAGFKLACTTVRGSESISLENPLVLKRRAVDNSPYLFL